MDFGGRDEAWLSRIEDELVDADRWSPAHGWMVVVFLVGFCTFVIGPVIGWLTAVVAVTIGLCERRMARGADRGAARA